MALNDTQLRFLEEFILRRKIRQFGEEYDPAGVADATGPGAVDPEEVRRIMAAAAGLATPQGASEQDAKVLSGHRAAISGFLDLPLTEQGMRAAAREVQEMNEAHTAIAERVEQDKIQRATQKQTLVKALALALQGQVETPLAQDADAVDGLHKSLLSALEGEPPEQQQLTTAQDLLQQLGVAIVQADKSAIADRERRLAEAGIIRQSIETAMQKLEQGTLEPEATDIPKEAARIGESLAGTPEDEALKAAGMARDDLEKAIISANEHTAKDRQDRVDKSAEITRKLGQVGALQKAQPDELQTRSELVEKVKAPLGDEFPTHKALEEAEEALERLTDHVETVQKEIDDVLMPRFAKGQKVVAVLKLISLDMPEQCPAEARQDLVTELAKATESLADIRDWAKIKTWNEEDLIGIGDQLLKLTQDAEKLREEVTTAVEVLRVAKEAATKAIGSDFSVAQSSQMQGLFSTASDQAVLNVLQAAGAIMDLEKLVKHAGATERIRGAIGKRIGALPDKAPAGASVAQKAEWNRLRSDALAAMDEVLDP